jgi:hypothetical protein
MQLTDLELKLFAMDSRPNNEEKLAQSKSENLSSNQAKMAASKSSPTSSNNE